MNNTQADAASADSASGPCRRNADCDDQLFCNGAELCMPDAATANARGCVAGPAPCAAGTTCDETTARCLLATDGGEAGNCDEDGDGVQGPQCGGLDCDDHDPCRAPNQRERCDGMLPNGMPAAGHDEDCDPCTVSGSAPDGDSDGDGYARAACSNPWRSAAAPTGCDVRLAVEPSTSTVHGQDCNDDPAMRGAMQSPGLPEVCGNSVDDNCDGQADFGLLYPDLDYDGSGDRNGTPVMRACGRGWSGTHDDCDDTRLETFPGAREQCDGRDNACALTGAMAGGPLPSEDMDGDHHSPPSARCLGRGETGALGNAFPKDDCDDASPTRYTGAMEICGNGIDEDCDGVIDNPTQRVCNDADRDGHGDPSTMRTVLSCTLPAGTVTLCDDCDDNAATGAARYPGNREVCDRVDNDCSTPGSAIAAEEDVDSDRYAPLTATCLGPGEAGAPATAFPRTDCDDTNAAVHPGAAENCDRVDSDCSSGGGVAASEDMDMDGWAPTAAACLARGEAGASSTALPRGDCDDGNPALNPGITENLAVCDGIDTDCNPATSELTGPCFTGGVCAAGGTCVRALMPVQLAVGGGFTCLRLADGTVYCAGYNSQGQLGSSGGFPPSTLSPVAGVNDAVELVAGTDFACVRRRGGTVSCWGGNGSGQLGDGTRASRSMPANVGGISNAMGLAAGGAHACAVLSDGTMRCWGDNSSGQLGATPMGLAPVAVPGVSSIVQAAAGYDHTCARTADGRVLCWGGNASGQLGDGTLTNRMTPQAAVTSSAATFLSAGGGSTCAVAGDGTVRCWGANGWGQLGDGTQRPQMMPTPVFGVTNATSVSISGDHSCVRGSDGSLRCWGRNAFGELGDGTMTMRLLPTPVPGVTNAVEVATAGFIGIGSHTCARSADGSIRCWGSNGSGQLADSVPTPGANRPTPAAATLPGVVEVVGGSNHSCARLSSGAVRCWGGNGSGQLGDGTNANRFAPVAVQNVSSATALLGGNGYSCAVLASGRAQCWGDNTFGQFGNGGNTASMLPTDVGGASPLTSIASLGGVAGLHTCARLTDSSVRCWGYNHWGQLGDGTIVDHNVATVVSGLPSGVARIVAGMNTTCAVLTAGGAFCWGKNSSGMVGDGTMPLRNTRPTAVVGVSNATQIVVGDAHTCALLQSGGVSCWGDNSAGQLGNGSTTGSSVPVLISGLANVAELAAGTASTCARLTNGTAVCWGGNTFGQLGDGTTTNRLTPTPVRGLSSLQGLGAGAGHFCARGAAGAVWCWGHDDAGQLGDHALTDRSMPTLLLDF